MKRRREEEDTNSEGRKEPRKRVKEREPDKPNINSTLFNLHHERMKRLNRIPDTDKDFKL